MAGIEKITGHILSDARTEAEAVAAKGASDAAAVAADYQKKAQELRDASRESSRTEADALVRRAEAAESNTRRNLLLEEKNKLLDEAFASAEAGFARLGSEKYRDFLSRMLEAALTGAAEREKAAADEERAEDPDAELAAAALSSSEVYRAVLSPADAKSYGGYLTAVGDGALEKYGKQFELGSDAAVGGGFILRTGDIETDCTLKTLVGEARPSLEAKVCALLFGEERAGNGS